MYRARPIHQKEVPLTWRAALMTGRARLQNSITTTGRRFFDFPFALAAPALCHFRGHLELIALGPTAIDDTTLPQTPHRSLIVAHQVAKPGCRSLAGSVRPLRPPAQPNYHLGSTPRAWLFDRNQDGGVLLSLPVCSAIMSIQQLPDNVIAQIKSSATITSLSGAVYGLVKNSLDAGATKITVSVDFVRGNCSVEDNGAGILPTEFLPSGGLGKLYCEHQYHHLVEA